MIKKQNDNSAEAEPTTSEVEVNDDKELEDELSEQYEKAETAHKEVRDGGFSWDDRENMFNGRYKNAKEDTKSVLSTGELTTLAIDGSCRVMAQMPTGRFYNFNGKVGSNMLANLLYEHYIVPNAVTGGPLLMKFRMANLYSRVLPAIPMFVEWKVTDRYIGPDPVIIHPRRFRPQPGKTAIEDMDYCFIDTEVSREWLEKQDNTVWQNVDKVLAAADGKEDEGSGTPEADRAPDQRSKTKTGITLRHRFKSNGDWHCFDPISGKVMIKELDYYSEIPIALKVQYPRLDSVWAINDFDRGEKTQKSIDTLIRQYLDGVAASIDPPVTMDPDQVVISSIVRQPKAKWFVKNGNMNAIKMENISPQGLNTFQSTYQILKGNLLSMSASSDTSVAASVDPGMGKTPEALKQQGSRQGARDAWDTFMQEQFIERVNTIMLNMIAKKGVQPFAFNLVGNSIKKIIQEYPGENYAELLGADYQSGKLSVSNEAIKGQYRYMVDPGSILAKDDTGQKLLNYVKIYNEYPEIKNDFAASKQKFNQGEAFKRAMIDDGIKDSEKIIVTEQSPESVAGVGDTGATVDASGNPAPQADGGAQVAPQGPDLAAMAQTIQQLVQAVQQLQAKPATPRRSPSETINYKDASPFIKAQIEEQAGLTPDPNNIAEHAVAANIAAPIPGSAPVAPPMLPPTPTQEPAPMPVNNQPPILG